MVDSESEIIRSMPALPVQDGPIQLSELTDATANPTKLSMAHIDTSLVDISEYKTKDVQKALLFRQWLLSEQETPKSLTINLHPYKAFFFACLIIKHINAYGLGFYQAQAVEVLFEQQALQFGLDYETLHQHFILSPLILNASDYLTLKNSEDSLWLIDRCLKSLTDVPTLNILLPFDKLEQAINILEKNEHELGALMMAFKSTRLSNAWSYIPTQEDIADDTLNIVLTYDNTTPNTPILSLILKQCSQLLKLDEKTKKTGKDNFSKVQMGEAGYNLAKQAIDNTYDGYPERQERLVLGNTRTVAPPEPVENITQSEQATKEPGEGVKKLKENIDKKNTGMGLVIKFFSKFKNKKAAVANLPQPGSNTNPTQEDVQNVDIIKNAEEAAASNDTRAADSSVEPQHTVKRDDKHAYLLCHLRDMGIFAYTKNPPPAY